ncbi:PilZ domain-containing protein [Sphingomonas xanthus]|uniref:PilZ domain-containing protein n=1 Tax=Sphingomonas xanthus TaxID=2594473 RepID=A0A516ITE7_9SPHN|nr:PilZ domain-containing protein [Sphingomonas xanthus]QDP20181.1 PilZ domain-containing protein [Sphingomonas xanthus]
MDESNNPQNRKSRRSNVLMAASLELSGTSLPVKLRNLSAEGALVEGDKLPVEGSAIQFRKGDLSVAAKVAWCKTRHAGISFEHKLDPDQVMRHVPVPRARVKPNFRRPGLKSQLSEDERRYGEQWLWRLS